MLACVFVYKGHKKTPYTCPRAVPKIYTIKTTTSNTLTTLHVPICLLVVCQKKVWHFVAKQEAMPTYAAFKKKYFQVCYCCLLLYKYHIITIQLLFFVSCSSHFPIKIPPVISHSPPANCLEHSNVFHATSKPPINGKRVSTIFVIPSDNSTNPPSRLPQEKRFVYP